MRRYYCNHCARWLTETEVPRSVKGKATGCAIGLSAGAASKNIWVALGLTILGTLVGHWIDENVTPECPLCGVVLRVIVDQALGG